MRFSSSYAAGHELRGVGLNLTRRCNLSCSYCRIVDNSKAKARRELSVAQWRDVIDRFVKHKHAHFIFTGGEPTLFRGLPDLVDHASKRALTSMISHTGLLDDALFDRLRNLDFLCMSFDTMRGAARPNDADGLQKDPSQRLAYLAGKCRAHSIELSAIVTVTSRNVDEIVPIAELLDSHGVAVQMSLIHSDPGHWDFRNHTPGLEFRTAEQHAALSALAETLIGMRKRGVNIAESEAWLRAMPEYAAGRFEIDCPAADPFVTVDYDGRIKACHDTPASDVSALEFTDIRAMRREVRTTVKPGCNCLYDCYFEARRGPAADLQRFARRIRTTAMASVRGASSALG